jgi:hypothetical protein
MVTQLKYHSNLQLAPGATFYPYNLNANSLYDPDRTGTGHQPMYYDQLCPAIYNRYRVTAISYKFVVSGANTPIKFQVHFQNNSQSNDYEEIGEMIGTKQIIVNSMANGGPCIGNLQGYTTLANILGQGTQDDRDQAVYNASPTNVVLLGFLVNSLDGATNISALNVDVTLNFFCELFDRVVTAGS